MLYEIIGGKKYIMASIYELINGKKYYWSTGGWGYAIIKISYNEDDQIATVTDPKGNLFHSPDKSGLWMFNATDNGTYTIHYPGADDQTVNITEKGQIVTVILDTQNYNSMSPFLFNTVKQGNTLTGINMSGFINKNNLVKPASSRTVYYNKYISNNYDFSKFSKIYTFTRTWTGSSTSTYGSSDEGLLAGFGFGDTGTFNNYASLNGVINIPLFTHRVTYSSDQPVNTTIYSRNVIDFSNKDVKNNNFVFAMSTGSNDKSSDRYYNRFNMQPTTNSDGYTQYVTWDTATSYIHHYSYSILGIVITKTDNINIFSNDKYGKTINEIINNSSALLSNADDVELMVKKLTGDFMIEALSSKKFKSAYDLSSNKSIIQSNPVWSQYLKIFTKYTSYI